MHYNNVLTSRASFFGSRKLLTPFVLSSLSSSPSDFRFFLARQCALHRTCPNVPLRCVFQSLSLGSQEPGARRESKQIVAQVSLATRNQASACAPDKFAKSAWSKMTHHIQLATALLLTTLTAVTLAGSCLTAQSSPAAKIAKSSTPNAANVSAAVCPVVYQLDDSPTRRGYHYIFYGNAFFINRDGYLLTAAHVLSEFRNGGQPSILLSRPYAPPRLVKVTVVATDVVHDVAILRATPNPFDAGYTVAALPLADAKPAAGDPLAIQALRPAHAKDPETFELPIPESYNAITLTYRAINLDPAAINAHTTIPGLAASQLTDIFLFSHEVIRGQSGAPVTAPSTHQVVGLIEGRWLHPASGSPAPSRAADSPARAAASTASAAEAKGAAAAAAASQKSVAPTTVVATPSLTQGAAVPISYAKSLLQKNHIPWTTTAPW
jgi:hypothetical protein